MSDNKVFVRVLAMRKADERQLRHFADRGAAPAHAKTPSCKISCIRSLPQLIFFGENEFLLSNQRFCTGVLIVLVCAT